MRALGISTSPRKNGNSDQLLRRALDGAASNGAEIEHIYLGDYSVAPCSECNACYKTGKCAIQDDYQLPRLRQPRIFLQRLRAGKGAD